MPSLLNSWPMKPCGVQLARPIFPPRLADAEQLGCGLVLVGREHHAEGRDDHIEAGVRERERLGVRLAEIDGQTLGCGTLASALEQRRHIIGRGHFAPAARSGKRHIPVPRRDVEHLAAGAKVERLAQLLADDLQGRADHRVVAGGPGALLALLDGGEIGLRGGGFAQDSCR